MSFSPTDSRGVSPVVGVILVVAITVILASVIGVFALTLGQNVPDGRTNTDIATRTTYNDDGTATIQVVTGTADEVQINVGGEEPAIIPDPRPGASKRVTASPESRITIIAVTDGEATVVSRAGSSTEGSLAGTSEPDSTATPTPTPTPTPESSSETKLVHHWTLDDSSQTEVVDHAGGLNGQLGSNHGDGPEPITIDGYTAYDFNQADEDYIDISGIERADGEPYTMSTWVRYDSLSDRTEYLNIQNVGEFVAYSGDLTQAFRTEGGTTYFLHHETELTTDQWYMVTVTQNAGQATLYINGVKVDEKAKKSASWDHTKSSLGGNIYNNQRYLDGQMRDVRFYNTALTAQEVSDLHAATK